MIGIDGFIIFGWLCSIWFVSFRSWYPNAFTLHEFCALSYDVRPLCRPLNKRIHPTIYIHPNYNRLWSVPYQRNPLVLLRSNGYGRLLHHLLNKVGKMFHVKFYLHDRLFYAVLNTNWWSASLYVLSWFLRACVRTRFFVCVFSCV